ncbi:MAG: DUF563 domain-containing protein [Cyanobacteria bacterium REEB65]|nr:DUF563 domain-containing protein [Cyanobacteria bacterium REEB65]
MITDLSDSILSAADYLVAMQHSARAFPVTALACEPDEPFLMYAFDQVVVHRSGLVVGLDDIPIRDCINRDGHLAESLEALQRELAATPSRLDPRDVDGEVMALVGPWCEGFWHWSMEYLTKALLAELVGFKGRYLISPHSPKFVAESLELLGIERDRLLVFDSPGPIRVRQLLMPQHFIVNNGKAFLSLLAILRERFLAHVTPSDSALRRIYVSRNHAGNGRRVVNEPELMEMLNDFNFEFVYTEFMTLKEQFQLMANTNCIVGSHGAGMFHTLLLPEASCIVELFSPTYINPCIASIVELLRHNYHMVTSPHTGDYPYGKDVEAPVDLIRITLKNHFGNLNSALRAQN